MYGRTVPQRVHHVGLSVACLSNFNPPAEPPPPPHHPQLLHCNMFRWSITATAQCSDSKEGGGRGGPLMGSFREPPNQQRVRRLKQSSKGDLYQFSLGVPVHSYEKSLNELTYSLFVIFLRDFRELCIWLRVLVARSMISTFRCSTIELHLGFIQSCIWPNNAYFGLYLKYKTRKAMFKYQFDK